MRRSFSIFSASFLFLSGCSDVQSDEHLATLNAAQTTGQKNFLTSWHVEYLNFKEKGRFRIGTLTTKQPPSAQVVYFPGFADRFENHPRLLTQLSQAGMKVISYDYPGHGESKANNLGLNSFTISDLAEMGALALEKMGQSTVPTYFIGWSTGGLVATRLLQKRLLNEKWNVERTILLAPALPPRLIIGEFGFVTKNTLTSDPNPPYLDEIEPRTPMAFPLFAASILHDSRVARSESWPKQIPVFIIAAGEDSDRYANSREILEWTTAQSHVGNNVLFAECPDAKHDLENEPAGVGPWVRSASLNFINGLKIESTSGVCRIRQ